MWLFKIKFVLICHSNNRKFPLSGKNSTVRHMCSILPFLFISYSTSLSFCFLVIGKGLRILGSLAHRGSGGGILCNNLHKMSHVFARFARNNIPTHTLSHKTRPLSCLLHTEIFTSNGCPFSKSLLEYHLSHKAGNHQPQVMSFSLNEILQHTIFISLGQNKIRTQASSFCRISGHNRKEMQNFKSSY